MIVGEDAEPGGLMSGDAGVGVGGGPECAVLHVTKRASELLRDDRIFEPFCMKKARLLTRKGKAQHALASMWISLDEPYPVA